ncbi:terpenoid cyclases/protein prenyltransferase alpha-alpha toroid [Syncephalis fuscata]|nr:terpenoid cyclases/protein prenyltransferase alpha-alpha toroid [Syncephalis fuscata]
MEQTTPTVSFAWKGEPYNDDNLSTDTSANQETTEQRVEQQYLDILEQLEDQNQEIALYRSLHKRFVRQGLNQLSNHFEALDASKPWLCFWIVHSLHLLSDDDNEHEQEVFDLSFKLRMVNTLATCQHPDGGFGGGPDQLAHLAPTYAAVAAITVIGEGYDMVHRERLYSWLLSLKQPDGSFIMSHGGEIDVRGSYCALTVASLLNIMTPELLENCSSFIQRCQTYEGGLGSRPGVEAHGGYTFCGLGAMLLMNQQEQLNLRSLTVWASQRQMSYEGGFQGRTNKLVDGCYAFWCAGLFPLLYAANIGRSHGLLLNREALRDYMLYCCQHKRGGLIDKPGKWPDFYHTCYGLSGLATVFYGITSDLPDDVQETASKMLGPMKRVHPIFNIAVEQVDKIQQYFGTTTTTTTE